MSRIGVAPLLGPSNVTTFYGSSTTSTDTLAVYTGTPTPTPPEIVETARALNGNIDQIYQYVRNNIRVSWMYGMQKGALGALIDKAGTPFDQADLMVKLLRQANVYNGVKYYTPSYESGQISLTGTQFTAWTGISDSNAACQMLANGGFPATVNGSGHMACPTTAGSAVTNVTMNHVWVKVVIAPGCPCGTAGTYFFDPAYKPYTKMTGITNLANAAGITPGLPLSTTTTGSGSGNIANVTPPVPYVNGLQSQALNTALQNYSQALMGYLYTNNLQNAQIEDVVGGGVITPDQPPAGGWRQNPIPYTQSGATEWTCPNNVNFATYCGVPNQYRTSLGLVGYVWDYNANGVPPPPLPQGFWQKTFDVSQPAGNATNPILFVDQIYGRRLTVATGPGLPQSATSKYSNQISLQLDGVTLATFNNPAYDIGEINSYGFHIYQSSRNNPAYITLTANHPYAADAGGTLSALGTYMDTTITKAVTLVNSLTVVDGFGDTGPNLFTKWADERTGDTGNPLSVFQCVNKDQTCGNLYPGGTGDFERDKMTANWLGQQTRAAQLHAAIGGGVVQLHHELGFTYGDTYAVAEYERAGAQNEADPDYTNPENINRLDVDSAYSVESRTADAVARRAMAQAIAATSATLEGSVAEQMDGVPDASSTALRFEWGNAPPCTAGNWDAPTSGSLNAYEDPGCPGVRSFVQYTTTNSAQATNVALVEGHAPSSYTVQPVNPTAAQPLPGQYATNWQSAYSSEIALYAGCSGTSCQTPGNVPFTVTTSQEAELGPGQRGGAMEWLSGNVHCFDSECDTITFFDGYTFSAPEQRGPAFVATAYDGNGDPVAIAHDLVSLGAAPGPFGVGPVSATKGGGGGSEKDHALKYTASDAGDVLKSRFVDKSNEMGVNLSNGTIGYTAPAKLTVGNGGFPYELSAEFEWHQAPVQTAVPPISPIQPQPGWVTNWNNNLTQGGSGLEAMGKSDVRAAVGTIAAFLAEQDIYTAAPSTSRDAAALLTQAWWDHQIAGNVVTATLGTASRQFVALPQGVTLPSTSEKWISTGGAYAKLAVTNSRVPYEQKCAPVHPPQPYALSRGWDYTGSTNGLPVTYTITSANGDVQTFQPWSNNYATNDFENCGFAEGMRLTTWTFPQGATVTLNYGNAWDPGVGTGSQGFDQLVSVTNSFAGGSAVRTLAFAQANGVITGVSNAASGLGSRAVTLQFGDYGNPISITDQVGAVTGFSYGIGTFEPGATRRPTPWASLYQITTPDGLLNTEYDYDSLGRIAQIKDAEALQNADRPPWQFLIADGTRGERDDPLGDAWVVDYDTYGHPMRYTDELGNVTLAQFDGRGQVTSHTFPEGDQELLQYDDHGNEASITKVPKPSSCSGSCPPNITISATWDQTWNKLASLTDANGKTTNFQYYASGYGKSLMQWAKRPAVGGARPTYNFTYDAAGKLLTSTDPVSSTVSITTQNTYDASENLTSTAVDPGAKNLKTTFAYDADANVWWTSDPNQNSTAQNGGTTVFTYDNDRRKLESDHHVGAYTGTLNAAAKTQYDLLGRVTEEDTAKCIGTASPCGLTGSAVATWIPSKVNTYTPTSKVATVTDADGALTSATYDNADRKFVVTDPVNRQTEYVYDAAGNVLQEIRGLGSPVQMTYATYQYLPDGEKQSVQDADGPSHVTTYSYDGFNRLIQTLYPDSTSEQVTLYDANSNIKTRVNRANQTFTMSYDSLNRLSTKVVPSYTLPSGTIAAKTVTTNYDLGGRMLETSDTVTNDVLNHYDTAGRLAKTDTTIAGLTSPLTSQYQFDPNSNRTQLQWPDGYQVNYAYDTLNRMTTATDSASTTLATYAYDAMSRRTGLTYGNTASLAYTYTDAGDLLTLLNDFTNNTKNVSYTLGYSPDHQLASEANSQSTYVWQPGLTGGTDSYAAVNAVNQYGSMTPAGGSAQPMTYDGNGNLTCSGTACPTTTPSANASVYTYDPENHLVAAGNAAHSSSYAFDPLGRRQTKTVDSGVTNFLNDDDDEIAEYDGLGNVLRRFIPGPAINEPVAYENCSGATGPNCSGATGTGVVTEYYHTDHHGSVIAMSGSNGNPVNGESGYTYDAYGNSSMSITGQPFRYVGMYFDSETGLYHDRARCYIPNLGRFCQTDPIGYKDDNDLYTYVGDDPIDKVDPSGLKCSGSFSQSVCTVDKFDGKPVTPEMRKEHPEIAKYEAALTQGYKQLQIDAAVGQTVHVKGNSKLGIPPTDIAAAALLGMVQHTEFDDYSKQIERTDPHNASFKYKPDAETSNSGNPYVISIYPRMSARTHKQKLQAFKHEFLHLPTATYRWDYVPAIEHQKPFNDAADSIP